MAVITTGIGDYDLTVQVEGSGKWTRMEVAASTLPELFKAVGEKLRRSVASALYLKKDDKKWYELDDLDQLDDQEGEGKLRITTQRQSRRADTQRLTELVQRITEKKLAEILGNVGTDGIFGFDVIQDAAMAAAERVSGKVRRREPSDDIAPPARRRRAAAETPQAQAPSPYYVQSTAPPAPRRVPVVDYQEQQPPPPRRIVRVPQRRRQPSFAPPPYQMEPYFDQGFGFGFGGGGGYGGGGWGGGRRGASRRRGGQGGKGWGGFRGGGGWGWGGKGGGGGGGWGARRGGGGATWSWAVVGGGKGAAAARQEPAYNHATAERESRAATNARATVVPKIREKIAELAGSGKDADAQCAAILAAAGGEGGIVVGADYQITEQASVALRKLVKHYCCRKQNPVPVIVVLQHMQGRLGATVWGDEKEVSSDIGHRADGSPEDPVLRAVNNAVALTEVPRPKPEKKKKAAGTIEVVNLDDSDDEGVDFD